jgi:hypothetical protein
LISSFIASKPVYEHDPEFFQNHNILKKHDFLQRQDSPIPTSQGASSEGQMPGSNLGSPSFPGFSKGSGASAGPAKEGDSH